MEFIGEQREYRGEIYTNQVITGRNGSHSSAKCLGIYRDSFPRQGGQEKYLEAVRLGVAMKGKQGSSKKGREGGLIARTSILHAL